MLLCSYAQLTHTICFQTSESHCDRLSILLVFVHLCVCVDCMLLSPFECITFYNYFIPDIFAIRLQMWSNDFDAVYLIISSLKDVMQMLIIPTDLTYFMVESRCQSNESISFKHNHDKHQKSQQGFPSVRQTHFKTFSLSLLSGKLLQNNFQPFCSLFSLSLSPLKCVASGREPTKKKERKNEITKKKKLDCETHGEERQRACRM